MTSQHDKAARFLQMHEEGGLLLPNAWDISSARLFENAGFPAIATTSAGVAFALGYPDGEFISRDEMLDVVGRIAKAVQVPVTADIEAGYGAEPSVVAETIRQVIAVGGVGVNLEDNTGTFGSLYPVDTQAERLAAARDAAGDLPLVINARLDTYLYQVGEEAGRLDETLHRAKAYLDAGATSVFVAGVADLGLIETLVKGIPGPLNILVGPGSPSAPEIFKLGVKRISVGSSVMTATMGLLKEIAAELRESGTYERIGQHPYSYGEARALFVK